MFDEDFEDEAMVPEKAIERVNELLDKGDGHEASGLLEEAKTAWEDASLLCLQFAYFYFATSEAPTDSLEHDAALMLKRLLVRRDCLPRGADEDDDEPGDFLKWKTL